MLFILNYSCVHIYVFLLYCVSLLWSCCGVPVLFLSCWCATMIYKNSIFLSWHSSSNRDQWQFLMRIPNIDFLVDMVIILQIENFCDWVSHLSILLIILWCSKYFLFQGKDDLITTSKTQVEILEDCISMAVGLWNNMVSSTTESVSCWTWSGCLVALHEPGFEPGEGRIQELSHDCYPQLCREAALE